MTVATRVLTAEQISSFEQDVIAQGVKLGNWWAKQVADSLRERQTLEAKREVVMGCLDEVRRWSPSGPGAARKATTVGAWKRMVDDWQQGQRD